MADMKKLEEKDPDKFGERSMRARFDMSCHEEPCRSHCVV